jgi:hypothetical protein
VDIILVDLHTTKHIPLSQHLANLAGLSSSKETMKMELEGHPPSARPPRKQMRGVAPSENMEEMVQLQQQSPHMNLEDNVLQGGANDGVPIRTPRLHQANTKLTHITWPWKLIQRAHVKIMG